MTHLARLAAWLQAVGPAGLFLAAALDAFVPLGHVVDPLVVVLSYSTGNPVPYAALATLGSVLGTAAFFLIARAGGEALARRHVAEARRARLERLLERWGPLTILVAAVLPPPFPLKPVIVLAAIGRMRLGAFLVALAAARAFRYGLEATLAAYYGEWVLSFMKERYPLLGVAVALAAAAALVLARRALAARPDQAGAR